VSIAKEEGITKLMVLGDSMLVIRAMIGKSEFKKKCFKHTYLKDSQHSLKL
jgi:hypothetical protein